MNIINDRVPELVNFGPFSMFVDSFRAVGQVQISEETSVLGKTLRINKHKRSTKLTFTGRVYQPEFPMFILMVTNNTSGTDNLPIFYHGLKFPGCTITGYTADDKGDEFVYMTITAVTSEYIEKHE